MKNYLYKKNLFVSVALRVECNIQIDECCAQSYKRRTMCTLSIAWNLSVKFAYTEAILHEWLTAREMLNDYGSHQ